MADPITAIAVISAAATVGKGITEISASDEKDKSLDLQAQQTKLQYQQKTLSNLTMLQNITDAQIAQASERGYALSSPSFNAVQRNTFNTGARMQKNLEIENSILNENNAIEKANVKKTLYTQLFGDILQGAEIGSGIISKMPKKPTNEITSGKAV